MAITFQEARDYCERAIFYPGARWLVAEEYPYDNGVTLTYRFRNKDTSYPPNYNQEDQEMGTSTQVDLSSLDNLDQLGRIMINLAHDWHERIFLHEALEFFRVQAHTIRVSDHLKKVDEYGQVHFEVDATDIYPAPFHPHRTGGQQAWDDAEPAEGDSLSSYSISINS